MCGQEVTCHRGGGGLGHLTPQCAYPIPLFQMEARHGIDRPELEDSRVMSVLMSKLGWKMEMYEFKKK